MMEYDFDKVEDRHNTNSVKWDFNKSKFGEENIIPMWIADMDFKVPEIVIEAIKKRADHGVFGYTAPKESYYNSVINWMDKHHNFKVEKQWICPAPAVVPALYWIVQSYTEKGDKVIIQPPVYHRFKGAIEDNQRIVVENPLKLVDGRYYMDFDDLEKKIDSKVKLLFLCSPHNPVGRVWTKEELKRLGEICLKNNIIVVADEIHSDLVFQGYKHVAFPNAGEGFANNTIICTAPTKTFNIAGLQVCNIIIPNKSLREEFLHTLKINAMGDLNTFGMVALEAAYNEGESWYSEVLKYIQDNFNFLNNYLKEHLPKIKVIKAEATYLAWVDFTALGMTDEELRDFLLKNAKVAFNDGYIFGKTGQGFQRVNLACSRSILKEALVRITNAISNAGKNI
ncbi:PatB family C-S lyase [Clostridium lundense]|uniref:PatB family C-S lyase n=1 Tax=Clostridium lundense TaxID=319475 RepID=UPI000482FF2E